MRQNVFALGATGNVGTHLLAQMVEDDVIDNLKNKDNENPTVVVGIRDSTHFNIKEGGFPREFLQHFASTRLRVGETTGSVAYPSNEDISVLPEMLKQMGYGEDLVYADATNMEERARDLHLYIIEHTRSKIVTANKNPIGRYDYDTYKKLTADPGRYQYSATAMAGLGAVPRLSRRYTIGDRIHQIDASLSGTLGFITDAMSKGMKVSEAIRAARKEGYTEPDYRDDLNGIDVARKLTILARDAGFPVGFQHIMVEPFLPEEYLRIADPEECLARIEQKFDGEMEKRIRDAAQKRETLRYMATLRASDGVVGLKVGLTSVSLDSDFARLKGTNNRIEVVTDMYTREDPYILQGPGAGVKITASNLREDLLNFQSRVSRF